MTLLELVGHKSLSWKAKGIAIAIAANREEFANPENKDKMQRLIDMGFEGSNSIRSGLTELKQQGILKITVIRNDGYPTYVSGNSWEVPLVTSRSLIRTRQPG